jgi:CMP-N,N'-diacetyllegionaminic acid synthase
LVSDNDDTFFVIEREENLVGDYVAKMAVIKDCLIKANKHYNVHHDIIVDLDITSPLRTVQDIHNAIEYKLLNRDIDIIFP